MKNIFDKNFIDVIPNFLNEVELKEVIKSLDGMPWYFSSRANDNTIKRYDTNLNFTFLDTPEPISDYSKLNGVSQNILKKLNHIYGVKFKPHNAYLNCYEYGDEMQVHTDRQTKPGHNRTVIIYLNSTDQWDIEWSGHTILFDKDKKNILKTSIPFRNNLLCFDGELPHGISPISKSCYEKRIILVYQTEIENANSDI